MLENVTIPIQMDAGTVYCSGCGIMAKEVVSDCLANAQRKHHWVAHNKPLPVKLTPKRPSRLEDARSSTLPNFDESQKIRTRSGVDKTQSVTFRVGPNMRQDQIPQDWEWSSFVDRATVTIGVGIKGVRLPDALLHQFMDLVGTGARFEVVATGVLASLPNGIMAEIYEVTW